MGQASNTNNKFLYDYFYNDNVLYAPVAFRMMVRFNNPRGLQVNNAITLLENVYDTNPSNTHCRSSLRITATYLGLAIGTFSWRFEVTMRGVNGASSSMTASVSTSDDNEYYQINVCFGANNIAAGNVQSGNVVKFGNL